MFRNIFPGLWPLIDLGFYFDDIIDFEIYPLCIFSPGLHFLIDEICFFSPLYIDLEAFFCALVSAMVPWAIQDAYEDPCVETIKSENLLALPQVVCHFTLRSIVDIIEFQSTRIF